MFNENVKTLMFDLSEGREIVDDGRVVPASEASKKIRSAAFEYLGLPENATEKQIKRALNSENGTKFFEVVEEVIDVQIAHGLTENEFYNQFVETKNMKDGDRNEFWAEEDLILTVSKMSGDHHDISVQRLNEGQSYQVTTDVYGIKVGDSLRLFLLGRKDWGKFVDAVAKAYINKVQTLISAQFATGTNLISVPATLTGTGALANATAKAALDAIIEKVGAANESQVVLMGSKTALKNLNGLTKIDWADPAASVKEAVANTGIIGNYEGTPLMEIPQKFQDKLLTTPIVPANKIYVMPMVDNKFIKFVDYGESEITVDTKGATKDDLQSYEVQRRFGVSTLCTRYYGVWTI